MKDTIVDIYLAKHAMKYPDLEESLGEFNRDIWSVLDAKSEGEALGKLKSVQQGEGLMAFVRLHQWFIRTSDQGWNQRRSAIMHPGHARGQCMCSANMSTKSRRRLKIGKRDTESRSRKTKSLNCQQVGESCP